jgi:hypothetical protein
MFRDISAHAMEVALCLRIQGLSQPLAPEDDGAFLHFFCQLMNKLVEAATKVMELIDAECQELLGLARTHIFSNLQHLRPDLVLLDIL